MRDFYEITNIVRISAVNIAVKVFSLLAENFFALTFFSRFALFVRDRIIV